MGTLVIAGKDFEIDAPIINWRESKWDATQPRCLAPARPCPGDFPYDQKRGHFARCHSVWPQLTSHHGAPPLAAVQAVITQFVFHHDGLEDAASCWEVLHNERGLSCHFISVRV